MRGNWFCEYSILKKKFLSISFQKSIHSAFKGIVSRIGIFIKFCEVTSVHFSMRWCFALKGQCHKIFCFRFCSWIIFPPSLWKSANLRTYKICYICRPSACVEICEFGKGSSPFVAIPVVAVHEVETGGVGPRLLTACDPLTDKYTGINVTVDACFSSADDHLVTCKI